MRENAWNYADWLLTIVVFCLKAMFKSNIGTLTTWMNASERQILRVYFRYFRNCFSFCYLFICFFFFYIIFYLFHEWVIVFKFIRMIGTSKRKVGFSFYFLFFFFLFISFHNLFYLLLILRKTLVEMKNKF